MAEENVTPFYHAYKYSSLNRLDRLGTMHGARRVIAFCLMTTVLPTILVIIPLYLRHSVYTDVTYSVAESDVLEMVNGISSIFCEGHSLKMNSSFSAFQVRGTPELSTSVRKHIQLKKSMHLPDDTLEYWGFFLPHGSRVNLSVCARWDGAHILVVKGDKTLRNCGNPKPGDGEAHLAVGQGQVLVTFEGVAQEFHHPDSMAYQDIENQKHAEELDYEGEVLEDIAITTPESTTERRKHRHRQARARHMREKRGSKEKRKELLKQLLNNEDDAANTHLRQKRRADVTPKLKLDGGIAHGGNAIKFVNKNDSSMSSFEGNLLQCHEGKILLHKEFPPSDLCNKIKYLENGRVLQTTHDVLVDGYYYYIFYSDNDFHPNDIHAIFDIFKPTYQYGNYSKACINTTDCTFPIKFLADEMVVVEVPTRDGIEHETDDITYLVSTCHPRMAIYAIFPVAVLFLILGCAFL